MKRGCSTCMHVCEQLYLGHVPERTGWPHGELLLQCVACGGRDTYPAAPGLPRGCRGLQPRVHSRWAGPVVRLVVLRVLESWRVIDRWWSAEPEVRDYREVELPGGGTQVECSEAGGPWQVVPQ